MEGVALSQVFTAVKVVTGVMSAMQSMQQGAAAKAQAEIQAAQARAKSERDAVNAEIEANNVLRKLRQTNASAVARGFAGGVSGFSGSSKLIQTVNEKYAGKDWEQLKITAKERRTFGEIQAQMFEEAGKNAKSASTFDAISSVATTAMTAYELMPGGSQPTSTVAGSQGYSGQTNMYGSNYSSLYGGNAALPNYSMGPSSLYSPYTTGSTGYWRGSL